MITRRKRIERRTPLKRTGFKRKPIDFSKRISPISDRRATERRMYNRDRGEYLREHPYCQVFIYRHALSEELVIRGSGFQNGFKVPRSTQVHHRNKANGSRLLDKRWWMAAAFEQHQWVEDNKEEARKLGLLLPIQADKDGRWGADQQAVTTRELLDTRHRYGCD